MRIFEADFVPDLEPGEEAVMDFLARASDDTGDFPIIPDDPMTIAEKYYRPSPRKVCLTKG